jgi:hypothetical protein
LKDGFHEAKETKEMLQENAYGKLLINICIRDFLLIQISVGCMPDDLEFDLCFEISNNEEVLII